MSQQELLALVVGVLDSTGIDYMLTGSLASSLQGEPRLTHDIDLIVAITKADIPTLTKHFSNPNFYLSEDAIRDAIQKQTMFNLLDNQSGEKVDFWILTGEPFDQSRFSRKRREVVVGLKLNVSTPEDTIIMKLKWAKMCGGSEKQLNDVRSVYEVQRGNLELDYVQEWVAKLNLETEWQLVLGEAE